MAYQKISTKNVLGYFIQDKKHENSPQFVPIQMSGEICVIDPDMKILASCNQGVLCCLKKLKGGGYRYYVGKPSTQQWHEIPNPKRGNNDVPKGIMVLPSSGNNTSRFAIVKLTSKGSKQKQNNAYQCEIFDSKFWAWRKHDDLIMQTSSDEFISQSPAVSLRSSIYWLTSEGNVVDLQFDKGEDNFKFEYIITGAVKNKYMKQVEFNDNLGYIILTEEGLMELWARTTEKVTTYFGGEEYQQEDMYCWNNEMSINLQSHEDQVKYPCHKGFYNVDYIGDLNLFREIICYEKLLDDSSNTSTNTSRFQDDGFNTITKRRMIRYPRTGKRKNNTARMIQYPRTGKRTNTTRWLQDDNDFVTTTTTTDTVRIDQLNVAVDVFRMPLDFKPINLRPRPTLSVDAKKQKSLQMKQVRKINWNGSIYIDGSSTSLVLIFVFVFLLSGLLLGGMRIIGVE